MSSRFRKRVIISTALLLPFFTVLQLIYYNVGDQLNYVAYYQSASSASPLEAYLAQRTLTGSAEPLYFFISYAAAKIGIPYSAFKVAISYALASSSALLLTRLRVPLPIIAVFLLFGYYWLALYTELERLAIAMTFFQMGILKWLDMRRNTALFLLVSSMLCHFQIVILIVSIIGGVCAKYLFSLSSKLSRRFLKFGVLVALLLGTVFLVLQKTGIASVIGNVLISKLAYYGEMDFKNVLQAVVAFPLFFYLSRGNVGFVFAYFLLSFFIVFLGGDRLNIFLIIISVFSGFYFRRAKDPLLILLIGYLTIKGIGFYLNIAFTGGGY